MGPAGVTPPAPPPMVAVVAFWLVAVDVASADADAGRGVTCRGGGKPRLVPNCVGRVFDVDENGDEEGTPGLVSMIPIPPGRVFWLAKGQDSLRA